MPARTFKPIFERTLSEQSDLMRPEAKRVQKENVSLGFYNSYRDNRYKSTDILVRKYNDRREVVKIDAGTGHIQIIKTIR